MAQLNTWAPPPTQLTTLPALAHLPARSKVRFFGLVQLYHAPSATLLLSSDVPPSHAEQAQASANRVAVDISVPLEDTAHTVLATGARVVVVGYVLARAPGYQDGSDVADKRLETREEREIRRAGVRVQALLLSDAGRTQGVAWNAAVGARQAALEAMKAAREQARIEEATRE